MSTNKYKFKNKNGVVKINSNLRVRGVPTTKSNVPLYEILANSSKCQNVLNFVGWVENGKNIRGNSKWYKDGNGHYFWSGNVTNLESGDQKSAKDGEAPTLIKGKPNPGTSENAKILREIIDHEFRFNAPFGKTNLQCTEYVQFRVLQKLGHKINWGKHKSGRNGGNWWNILQKTGYSLLGKPEKDCVVSFTKVYTKQGVLTKEGHVAFVESVGPNNSIFISEANWPSEGQFNKRSIPKEKWKDYYEAKFVKII